MGIISELGIDVVYIVKGVKYLRDNIKPKYNIRFLIIENQNEEKSTKSHGNFKTLKVFKVSYIVNNTKLTIILKLKIILS